MKCGYKYSKISTPYTESKAYSEEISKQQGGVYCDIDDYPCHEDCDKHLFLRRQIHDIMNDVVERKQNDITQLQNMQESRNRDENNES